MDAAVDHWTPGWLWGLTSELCTDVRILSCVADRNPKRSRSSELTGSVLDEELVLRFRRGDHQAFLLLYTRYRASVLRFAARILPNPSDAEEIVQETWLAVIRGRESHFSQGRFVTYLFAVARRRCIDRWRRQAVRAQGGETISDFQALQASRRTHPDVRTESDAIGAAIQRAVESLPFEQRETFLLRAVTDLTIAEIAEVTGTTRETAKSRLRYGLNRLRTALEPWNES